MNLAQVARRSLRMLWEHKVLWFFGLFAGAAGAGASGGGGGAGGGFAAPRDEGMLALALAAGLVALLVLGMNIVSEAALIRGVSAGQDGERLGLAGGMREGRRHFWTLTLIKVLALLAFAVSAVLVSVPVLLGVLHVVPAAVAFVLAVPLALVSIPWFLTLFFVYQYAMRFAVLHGLGATAALRAARRHLHGRLESSLKLAVLSFAGQLAGNLLAGLLALPGALVGVVLYFAVGMVPAMVVGLALAAPVVLLAVGATGAFQSSVWTLGFLEARS